jgi:hypothetical protein
MAGSRQTRPHPEGTHPIQVGVPQSHLYIQNRTNDTITLQLYPPSPIVN